MDYKLIRVLEHYDRQVVEIVLGPGSGNIITTALTNEVIHEMDRVEDVLQQFRHLKLVIFSGDGKHFSYGASVEEHKPDAVGEMLPRFHRLIERVLECNVPTLAKVSGLCLGGGFELALACAMMFSADNAKFGVPEIQLGVFPPVASVLLPLKTSDAVASEIILSGEKFSAGDLHRLGIINHVVSAENLEATVARFIEEHMLPKSASSLRIACQAARLATLRHYRAHIADVEKLYLSKLMSTADAAEGIQSFLDKRSPAWKDA